MNELSSNSSAAGFASVSTASAACELRVEGALPSWLRGTFVHTGPGLFDLPRAAYRHWFDGLALLTSIVIDDGHATYRSKFLESEAYRAGRERGAPAIGEFDTQPPASWLGKMLSVLKGPGLTDNANVNVAHLSHCVIAMTETNRHMEFDPDSLATRGEHRYDDSIEGQVSSAHPQIDRRRNLLYNLLVRFGRRSSYEIYELPLGTNKRRAVASLPTDTPSYMHSFGASEHHVILTEFPLCAHPLRMRFSRRPFIERYVWRPERGTRIRVVRKSDGALVSDLETDAFFAFHHVNAVEHDGHIQVDLLAYPDPTIIGELRLEALRSARPTPGTARLVRLALPLGEENARVTLDPLLGDQALELPRISPHHERRPYRFLFAVGNSSPHNFFDEVLALDLSERSVKRFRREGWFPNEPLFVPRPQAEAEDDGVLLAIVVDAEAGAGRLIVLDAQTLELRAHAQLPQLVPFHFHGQFFGRSS